MAVAAPRRLISGFVPKASVVVSADELSRASELLFASDAMSPPVTHEQAGHRRPKTVERGPDTGALNQLQDLVKRYGAVHQEDVEVLARRLAHGASRAMRETFDAVRALKESGALARINSAETITPEILARVESGRITAAERRHLEKIARIELFKLFDDPVRDDDFRVLLASELKRKHKVTNQRLDDWEVPLEITLRERHGRQANALRAVLHGLKNRGGPQTRELELASIRRLGACADITATPVLDEIIRDARDPSLVKAAKVAKKEILKAARMTIVFAAMEAKPYCGTGGLSNVMAELPKALAKMGHKVVVLVPRHASMKTDGLKASRKVGTVYGPQGAERFGLLRDRKDGVDYYFIENDRYFSAHRDGIYGGKHGDYHDNAGRYDFFGASIPVAIRAILGPTAPDVVQLNDAHTATASVYLKADPAFKETRTILAVHNLGGAYQGKFDKKHLHNLRFNGLGHYYPGGPAEFYDQLNFMKLGLNEADASITVSREYMKEILTEETGEGLHGVLRVLHARGRLWGNLNGIDNETWNPQTDPLLKAHFSFDNLTGKASCKADLQHRFGLASDPNAALIGVVARLTNQKGFDDIIASIERAMEANKHAQFVVLGQGEQPIAEELRALVKKYPGKVAFDQKFTVDKEHLIYGGSDFFLMPSKFEPCGLPQMYALRYATVPIVRAVGGLNESIQDYNPRKHTGNGFKFGHGQASTTIHGAIDAAVAWYESGAKGREALLRNCAFSDFSWEKSSALEQLAFYRKIINRFARKGDE